MAFSERVVKMTDKAQKIDRLSKVGGRNSLSMCFFMEAVKDCLLSRIRVAAFNFYDDRTIHRI